MKDNTLEFLSLQLGALRLLYELQWFPTSDRVSRVPGCGQAQYQAPWISEMVRSFCLQERLMDGCYMDQALGRPRAPLSPPGSMGIEITSQQMF